MKMLATQVRVITIIIIIINRKIIPYGRIFHSPKTGLKAVNCED